LAAEKNGKAAKRFTTKREDIAYCLLGIFNINMPLLYGEGEKAFKRLQEEIMKESDDQSIFSWQGGFSTILHTTPTGEWRLGTTHTNDDDHEYPKPDLTGLLADSPRRFRLCSDIIPLPNYKNSEPYSMTNAGLRVKGPLFGVEAAEQSRGWRRLCDHLLFISCYNQNKPDCWIGILLRQLMPEGDQFARANPYVCEHTGPYFEGTTAKTIFIRNEIIKPALHQVRETGKHICFNLSPSLPPRFKWDIIDAYPADCLDRENMTVRRGHPMALVSPMSVYNFSWHAAIVFRISPDESMAANARNFAVLAGYNGAEDRCWVDLDGIEGEDAKSVFGKDLNKVKDEFSLVKLFWRFDDGHVWQFQFLLLDSAGKELHGSVTARWDNKPIKIQVNLIKCWHDPDFH